MAGKNECTSLEGGGGGGGGKERVLWDRENSVSLLHLIFRRMDADQTSRADGWLNPI